ncbi:hypothetical protein OIU76_008821 [Salix suchowensis]|nr:hypothetical protein OIU76_008821 [Salix suchowensis]
MDNCKEHEKQGFNQARFVKVLGPIIVGAGPSGLAVAACLSQQGVPFLILEKNDCIASLWQQKTYDRLKLHLPKQFCELPLLGFPGDFPKWLIVATGENAEPVIPDIAGYEKFRGTILHTSEYKSGSKFKNQRVLVIGCGNSGMEVSLDLCRHNAIPHMVVRNTVHVLPREMFGMSTFGIAMALLKWLPLRWVDKFLLLLASFILGNTDQLGLKRPKTGPIELKNVTGKTPVLDVGALSQIKSGKIKVMEGVKEITRSGVKFMDGQEKKFESIILATGYKSNVPTWLKGCDFFTKDGMPAPPFPDGWKGGNGLYTVGFTRRGLLGTASDAVKIARDIGDQWKTIMENSKSCDSHVIILGRSW